MMEEKIRGLSKISGPLIALDGVTNGMFDELVELVDDTNHKRLGRIIELKGDRALVQVFEDTQGLLPFNGKRWTLHEPVITPVEELIRLEGAVKNG